MGWYEPRKQEENVEGITKVMTDLGIPSQATTVIIAEIPRENWATGGKLHSETPWNPQPPTK